MAQKYANMAGMNRRTPTRTSQTKPIPGREDEMIVNPAGGYSFEADKWARLDRFLILGVPGNSIYQSQGDMVKESASLVSALLGQDGIRVVDAAAEVMRANRSMKVDAPLFVLSMGASCADDKVRAHALSVVPDVIRTPTHLFTFLGYVQEQRGWGRALRRTIARYYTETALPKLVMHSWKYKSREGWSHRDALRLAHAKTDDAARNAVLRYMVKGEVPEGDFGGASAILSQIEAAEKLVRTKDVKEAVGLIRNHRLTREAVPTELLNEKRVWEALLDEMPLTAMVRNLGKMTQVGLVTRMSDAERMIVDRLRNQDQIAGSRMHPMQILIAMKQYQKGRGHRGSLSWDASSNIVDALNGAFEMAFGNVEVTGKRILLAGDDSGSMTGGWSGGVMDGIMTPAEAAAAMMYITYRVEPHVEMIGYSDDIRVIKASRNMTVTSLLRHFGQGGGTNTALPIHHLLENKMDVDAVVSYTDNCTWGAGSGYHYGRGRSRSGHVTEVLRDYQNKVGHPVRFVNCAMEAGKSTDVDPTNPNMFEIVGLASDTPRIIGEFVSGRI